MITKSQSQAFKQASAAVKFDDGFAAPDHLKAFTSTVAGLATIDSFVSGTVSRITSQRNLEMMHKLIASLMTTSDDWSAYKAWTKAYRASVKHHVTALTFSDKEKKAIENRVDYELTILRTMAKDSHGWILPTNPAPRSQKNTAAPKSLNTGAKAGTKKASDPKVTALQTLASKDARVAQLISMIIDGKADKIVAAIFNKDGSIKKQYA